MSGINAPSVATYQYTVDNQFSKYVNVSFPFRVRITEVWFTCDANLLGYDTWWNQANSWRSLALAGLKGKSPKKVLSSYDYPTDWAPLFGVDYPENQDYWTWGDENLKPTLWLGIPDDASAEQMKKQTTQYLGTPWYGQGFRSASATPPAFGDSTNPYWGNEGWSESQFTHFKYKTDIGVMNPDEIVSFFVYQAGGNWNDYDGQGSVTIHVAYEGVGAGISPEDTATPWSGWFYD